jgi:crotonobetaine/carnitine-CoA ligase
MEEGSALAPLELIAFMARRLPPFMVPRYIETTEALPRTPTNKVKKRELAAAGNTARTWDRQAAGVRLRDFYE